MTTPRGRPPKFGRPAQLIALTLPEDVLDWLKGIHPDPGWAIVRLFDRYGGQPRAAPAASAAADIALFARNRGLIVVDRRVFRELHGIALIPLSPTLAFLALEPGRGLADLELAVVDRLDDPSLPKDEREPLAELRKRLRDWRRSRQWTFTSRSIIVAEPRRVRRRGALNS